MSRFPSVYTGPVNQRGEINTTKVKDLSSFIIKKGTIEEALPAEVKCCACSFGCSRTGGVDMVQYSLEGTNNKTGYSLLPLTTDILKTALKWLPDQKYKDEGYRVHTVLQGVHEYAKAVSKWSFHTMKFAELKDFIEGQDWEINNLPGCPVWGNAVIDGVLSLDNDE